jgi:hypothetical protein
MPASARASGAAHGFVLALPDALELPQALLDTLIEFVGERLDLGKLPFVAAAELHQSTR